MHAPTLAPPPRPAAAARARLRRAWAEHGSAKRVLDVAGALALLALLGLPLALTALALAPGGPPFVREVRLGRGGRRFRTWRFRASGGPVAAVLDAYALDGLPQLLNVVRGEMSLVGPAPQGGAAHPDRLHVRPGMTGLWQVGARSDLPWEEMALLDRHYVEHHWLGMDLAILARTPRAVLALRRARRRARRP
ncbi:sugar transferase [Streptomyces antimicrobicus]|uniref:Sugar transferase n=1 Tax=Streptomyces antimicrobicus TaxID=2883108 RepID=A0ABS8B6M9_9ACTN|nr:sugar transferase [Streptomyces antimicrobicus]MCB5180275.1 sugar transferase [Streptomyces antimicrobicus]